MSNQVGFSFQGDVTHGASLIYAGTGRLLKALSDGGVDFYAVGAAVQLGKCFEISQARELQITRLVQSRRTGRAGFLAKALSIGWGHSDVAAELIRIRSGAAALLLMSALTAGSTHFIAAQAFSELLSLAGCSPDMLPTVDAIRPMIAYLAPFVTDGTFDVILSNVTGTIQKVYKQRGQPIPSGLLQSGDPAEWSKAVHQLMLCASRREEIILLVKQRAAWIGTFASYVLDMRVRILDDSTLWEAAGTRGHAIIYLERPAWAVSRPIKELILVPSPADGQEMDVSYALREVLDRRFALEPKLNEHLRSQIRVAIVRSLLSMSSRVYFGLGSEDRKNSITDSGAQLRSPIDLSMRMCDIFNISEDEQRLGLDTFKHQSHDNPGRDDCSDRMLALIHGVSCTALALMLCTFDEDSFRVSAALISGEKTTRWYQLTRTLVLESEELIYSLSQALAHLSDLIHGHRSLGISSDNPPLLAASAGTTTVYCKAVLDEEAFDASGRTISIASGRMSMSGVLRTALYERNCEESFIYVSNSTHTKITSGSTVSPLYIPGPASLRMNVSLSERNMILDARVVQEESLHKICLLDAIHSFMVCRVGETCGHAHDCELVVDRKMSVVLCPSLGYLIPELHDDQLEGSDKYLVMYAVSGRRVELMIQIMILLSHLCDGRLRHIYQLIYQGPSCLDCIVRKLRSESVESVARSVIVMS